MPRTTSREFQKLVSRSGYGVASSLGQGSAGRKDSNPWAIDDMERAAQHALQGEKALQINYASRPLVRITFYRYRLADHSRAVSEKALVDALQYCGAIRGDSLREIRLEVEDQKKVGSEAEERTEIVIEYDEVDFDNLFRATGRTDGR